MKKAAGILVIGLAALVTSCSTTPKFALQPVGPKPVRFPGHDTEGQLQVFTATQSVNDGNITYHHHTDYTVFTPDGKKFKHVGNHIGLHSPDPEVAKLPAGSYVIIAEADYYSMVKVPVVIQGGQRTVVNLERDSKSPDGDAADKDLVRFPNGWVIGWKAQVTADNVRKRNSAERR